MASQNASYVLGMDLGSNSLGWAALQYDNGRPAMILASGVRVFPAGVSGLESGRDESNAAKRRVARLQRRQTDRRRRRINKIFRIISGCGLLPEARTPEERTQVLAELDRVLAGKFGAHEKLPFVLRARALGEQLELVEVGRALFHLAQRRGFLSNRKSKRESEDERGKVKSGITSLASAINASGATTLGEFLSRLDANASRIRGRYTSRQMYVDEFEAIWSAQQRYYPEVLNEGYKHRLRQAMFFQRPLRDQSDSVGKCDLEPGENRAPVWHPLAQRFRLLQEVNNTRLLDNSGTERPLDDEERKLVIARLERGDMPLKELRKLLGLGRGVQVNLDRGGKRVLIGDRTTQKMYEVFQERWSEMTEAQRMEAISDLAGDQDDATLAARAGGKWGLNDIKAHEYAETALEDGKYLSLSLKAIRKLLPGLEDGCDVTTARMAAYPETFRTQVRDLLPSVTELRDIRNPAVLRSLSELRKVVNALIRSYGKPLEIHIELARDLKASRPEREEKWKRMRQLEAERTNAASLLLKELGIAKPSSADIEKWRLADECNWRCAYSLRGFSKHQLFNTGEVQIEHIIPLSCSLDDSFANKTLAYSSMNTAKGNRSPHEAFGETAEWDQILEEVKRFKGPYARHKLHRFQWTDERVSEILEDFTKRQLNDTRYASKIAARYLACLYGALSDDSGKQRIFVSSGQVTAFLRRLWGVQGLLSGEEKKTRDDHRHHLIDAAVVALTGPKWVKALSDAAEQAREAGRRRFASIESPWPGFAEDLRRALAETVVSVRPDHKVRGALHEETFYGIIEHRTQGRTAVKRKPVHTLSRDDVLKIVDDRVRERVQLQLGILQQNFKKLESDPPTLPTLDGRSVKIRKVRIRVPKEPRQIGSGIRQRNVVGGDYHHYEILRRMNPRTGTVSWDFVPISVQDAMERVKASKPLVDRNHGERGEFVCSVSKGDTLEIEREGAKRLVVVQVLEANDRRVGFKDLNDARPYSLANRNRDRCTVAVLMNKLKCRKVVVSPLGEVHSCHE